LENCNHPLMKKYIVLSISENQDYIYLLPITVWTWLKFGWEPIVLFERTGNEEYAKMRGLTEDAIESFHEERFIRHSLDAIEGVRGSTVAQASRLFAGALPKVNPEDYLMLGDCDMLALGDHWKPDFNKVTVWNWDLTGYGEIPMCYCGAPASIWHQIMGIETNFVNQEIAQAIGNYQNAKSDDFYTYWGVDQQILTLRLKEYGHDKITFINRGQGSHGYARGRVDRGAGGWRLDQPELIDAHLEQQTHHKMEKIERLYKLLGHVWPNEDFKWFHEYSMKFRELTGHKG
jgi:hypothetical protein